MCSSSSRSEITRVLNSFIIVLREGFASFLLVAVILSYLRKAGQKWLSSAVYAAILLALAASFGLAYVLKNGVDDSVLTGTFGVAIGGQISQFLRNGWLREWGMGAVAIVMGCPLVI